MANFIYSRTTDKDKQTFYLVSQDREYYLFTQKYRKGVKEYFHNKVLLRDALDVSKSRRDAALIRTKTKFPIYIRYIEKEYGITVLESTMKKQSKTRNNSCGRYGLINDSCDYAVA